MPLKKKTLFFLAAALCSSSVFAADFIADVKNDTQALCAAPSRLLGSPGHAAAKEMLAARIETYPAVKRLIRQPFPVMVPETRRSELTITAGEFSGTHQVYPVWPDNVRMKTTPPEGISGNIMYIGTGQYDELPAKSLRGAIAAIEMSVYDEGTWLRAFEFGADAVLLLGSPDDSASVPLYTSIYKPRYYIPDGSLAEAIRRQTITGDVTIHCDGEWVEKTGENLLALVPGTDPALKPVLLIARYDAMSIIPGLAPGADNAVDAAFLLRFLDHLSQHPPKRGVIVAFVDAFGFNLLGTRELMGMLSITPDDLTRQAYEKSILDSTAEYEKLAAQVEALGADYTTALPQLADTGDYKELQRYVKDILSPEILGLREEIFALRLDEVHLKGDESKAATALKEEKLDRKAELDSILSGIISKGTLPEGLEDECRVVWEKLRHRVNTQLTEIKQQPLLFKSYDNTRAEVLAGMGITAPDPVAIPFVLGIDLSDSGINVGPSFMCDAHFMNYNRSGRQFTRWLKKVLKDTDNPYADIAGERLAALGLRADGLQQLVKKILNTEALEGATTEQVIKDSIPGLDDAAVQRIITGVSMEKGQGAVQLEEAAFRVLAAELPDLKEEQIEMLVNKIVNQESIQSGVDAGSLSIQRTALLTNVAGSFQMTGVTWSTLESIRHRLDTPQDTYDRLDWDRLAPQIRMTALLVEMMLNDPSFEPVPDLVRGGTFPKWRMPDGVLVSESVAETIARTPRPGMLVTTFNGNPTQPQVVAMRGHEFVLTGSDGRFRFRPKPADTNWPARNRRLKGYELDEHGRIARSIVKITSMLASDEANQYNMNQKAPLAPLRADTFECVELNGPVFRDPRYQAPMSISKLFDVRRGGVPKKHFWGPVQHPMFALVEPGTHYQVILGKGGGKNRMALMNVPDDLLESGESLQVALKKGFPSDKPLPALPELISARDFFLIDEWRLRRLEGAGVVCKAIREIHEETREWLKKADEAYAADQGAAYKRAATVALANEIRVYQAAQDQANDVTRGAIFLLLLLVPFSIAMERLLFASPEIAKQISKAMMIFVIMFFALASFHPGFKITSMPAVILIAFMVLLLSVSVINMILRKFRADMEELRRGTLAEASGAQTGRGGVIMSAIWLGIANMRKRFVRTMLTGLTIVLVTFSLLCFTSSSTYQNKRTATLEGVQSNHNGVLLQHPSEMPLDNNTLESVANMLGEGKEVIGRYWAVSPHTPEWRIHVRNAKTNQLATLKAGLGLDPREDKFITAIPAVLNHWEQFAEGGGCYISTVTAQRLGAAKGTEVVVAGTPLKVIDTFDPRALETHVNKLDGRTILPLDYSVQKDDWVMGDQSTMETTMASGQMAEPDPTLIHVSGDEVIILPVALANDLGASLRSIVIRSKTGSETSKTIADALVKDIAYPLYYGAADGVKVIVSTPLIPKAPRKIFIPILIAALIIFNTMLNSIAERKKEIYIYSSLGLAPRHIGVLFLAEALTYGVMGSVFGYIIGQGVATVLTKFDLMGGITLNYSGSNVILTMGLVLLVVILSALVPAYMATKVASPSGDLDWKVPQPKDRRIRGLLPFTVSQKAAPGLAAFLYDYLVAHADGAIGNFTSDNVRLEKGDDTTVVCLKSTIWPAPYDLGVRQDIAIRFDLSEGDICDLKFQLDHQAGPERSWWRLNRVFLGNIRAQLLGWRNVAPERMLRYIRQADSINQ
ncbi:MAG: FtsX-like permease family protein [Lentisphaeria bacterium]|nr:FtsX-like permease family protein [Lentisphaeria bacterium]